ncbi:hypothetical protein [Bradyrhizobium sp.]|uniref:hypothetical protein n=1 Tax=Bradyrhizobium sp. TaxID=376 RepID=UPI001EC6D3E7|nr:hypothetical protein [Bradyrhizobium sp.]MBV8919415.1 hypothetical protein [Bradyrhizobium sp.]MBV9983749.1 hypothetical protein [Bradyrhizobium sp.]
MKIMTTSTPGGDLGGSVNPSDVAYMIHPFGDGPFPLLVINHGVSLDQKEPSFFPVIELRDAAVWFARQGCVVVGPVRPGYAATAIEKPERGLFRLFFEVGDCSEANFRDAGLAIASIDLSDIDRMSVQPFIKRDDIIVSLPLDAVAKAHQGVSAQLFEQKLEGKWELPSERVT